jgi:hypothetical protein
MFWLLGAIWLVVVGGMFLDDSLEYERWIGNTARALGRMVRWIG